MADDQQTASLHVGAVTADVEESMRAAFLQNPANRASLNAVTKQPVTEISLNRDVVCKSDFSFSTSLDQWKVTSQKSSGRCWIFAGLNVIRYGVMKNLGLKEFELSQVYPFFYDKYERSNYFFEKIIELSDKSLDDRTIAYILTSGFLLCDGGQWNMFVNLVKKYGIVPKSAMPETESSSNTRRMNMMLRNKLREGAKILREAAAQGKTAEELRSDIKPKLLQDVYNILSIHLGTPPKSFNWQWTDSDRKFHRDGEITPLQFAEKYMTMKIGDYVCLVNDPRKSSPVGKTFTVDCLGNVIGGDKVVYVNAEMDVIKTITKETVEGGEAVWFGCDCGKMFERKLGIWDMDVHEYDLVYGTKFDGLSKSERLEYGESLMTHAMVITGVDVTDGKTNAWRIENSWGEDKGRKGFYSMADNWFDEYVYEVAVPKSTLSAELQAALEEEPIVLPAWDPMGALAGDCDCKKEECK